MITIYPYRAVTANNKIVNWSGGIDDELDCLKYGLKRLNGNFYIDKNKILNIIEPLVLFLKIYI